MKKIIFLFAIVISISIIIADNPMVVKISEGKNNFTTEEYFSPIYASQLISTYPDIRSISTEEYGQTFGYVNLFGGVGTNFLIESGKKYEIYTAKNITIELK